MNKKQLINMSKEDILKKINSLQKAYNKNESLKMYQTCIGLMEQITFYTNEYKRISNNQLFALNAIIESRCN